MALEKQISRTVFTITVDGQGVLVGFRRVDTINIVEDGTAISTVEAWNDVPVSDPILVQEVQDVIVAIKTTMVDAKGRRG